MKSNIKIIAVCFFVTFLLLMGLTVVFYKEDSNTAQEAMVVRAYMVNFCMENTRYLSKEEFDKRFPQLAADPDWFYRPAEDLTQGAFQYPMNLPLPSAPGDAHFSDLGHGVFSYTVRNPCQVFTRELL